MRALILYFAIVSNLSYAEQYHVSINGNDMSGDGSIEKPWRTIGFALETVAAGQGHTINISPGTFYINSALNVQPGINIRGAGKDSTIIKGSRSFHYNPKNPGFEPGRFILRLDGPLQSAGDQSLTDFTIDGSSKKVHGGIYINGRANVRVENVNVQYTNFCGIWILHVTNFLLRRVTLKDCAWGSEGWCSGALQFAYVDHLEIDQLHVDEGKGYGIKTLGHDSDHNMQHFKLHDSYISVDPKGLWQNGKAPNIAIEIWSNRFVESEIYNCYFDNHISIVNSDHNTAPSGKGFRIHHNLFDIQSRAEGAGYGIELTVHDVEIDHNIFKGGFSGIANWTHPKKNWSIHHNVFYGLESVYPSAVIKLHQGNMKNVNIYNNTVELTGNTTISFLQCDNGGVSEDIVIRNNLIINSNTGYSHYPNRFVSLEKGATIKNLVVENNLLHNLSPGDLNGIVRNNISSDPKIMQIGSRPFPYYRPALKSPLVQPGRTSAKFYTDKLPYIGAYQH